METEVYVDLLFLVNFSMDFLTLYLVARLSCRPLRLWRAMTSAILGALYAAAALLFFGDIPLLAELATDVLACLALTGIGLYRRRESKRMILRLSAMYLLISALLGGLMTVMSVLLNRVVDPTSLRDAQGSDSVAFSIFPLVAAPAVGVCMLLGRSVRRTASCRSVVLSAALGERSLEVPALCDSGNLLRDPITNHCVIPIDLDAVEPWLPDELSRLLRQEQPMTALTQLPPAFRTRTRLIPAHGATGEKMLIAFRVDHLYLNAGNGRREICAYLAPVSLPHDVRRDYRAIVPTELLHG